MPIPTSQILPCVVALLKPKNHLLSLMLAMPLSFVASRRSRSIVLRNTGFFFAFVLSRKFIVFGITYQYAVCFGIRFVALD